MGTSEKPRVRSRIWKWTRRVIVTLFLFLVFVVCAVLVYISWANHRGDKRLMAALAELRSRGLPLTREQLYKDVVGRDEEAARLYFAAFELARPIAAAHADLPYVGHGQHPALREPLDPALAKKLRKFADASARYFALLDEARSVRARIPILRFYDTESPGVGALSHARQAASRYLAMSLLAQAEGKPDEALLACGNAIALNSMFDGQPLMLTVLTRASIGSMVARATEGVLSRATPSAERLRDLKKALLAEDGALDVQEMVKGDLALMAEVAANPALTDMAAAHKVYAAMVVQRGAETFRRNMEKTFREMDAVTPDLDSLVPGLSVTRSKLRAHLALYWSWHCLCPGATKEMHAVAIRRAMEDYDLAGQSLPELASRARSLIDEDRVEERALNPRAIQLLLTAKAELRVAACAIDAEVHRIVHGRWPDKLADTGLPADPFTGQPVKYKRVEKGYVVYSIGPNLVDEGAKGRENDGDDVSFCLFGPAERQKP